MEEGIRPHPRCDDFNMLVSWAALDGRNSTGRAERKQRRLTEDKAQEGAALAFKA